MNTKKHHGLKRPFELFLVVFLCVGSGCGSTGDGAVVDVSIEPTCDDGVRNGDEADIDCGGACTPCATPSCTNDILDDGETDIDCGGFVCSACDVGGSCVLGVDCATGVCTEGQCAASTCEDGVVGGEETGIDCGGRCSPCEAGTRCVVDEDCLSAVCANSLCAAPSCTDTVLNGEETDIDCGGICSGCAADQRCAVAQDCVSGLCQEDVCRGVGCEDGIQGSDETDVDCGGACGPCDEGLRCEDNSDCATGNCVSGFCRQPSCEDSVRNGNETDTDCGGDLCEPCRGDAQCLEADDCISGVCTEGRCQAGACEDSTRNGDETDTDCGGPDCMPCSAEAACLLSRDCVSGVCSGDICQMPSCEDSVLNGDESGVDCGVSCAPCGYGERCTEDAGCVGGVCFNGLCQIPSCADGVQRGNEVDVDCGGPDCGPCAVNLRCEEAAGCESGVCRDDLCQASTCDDEVRNGDEIDIDCGGMCGPCRDGDVCAESGGCVSGVCNDGVCQPPRCDDSVFNSDETDIDCGGNCPACDDAMGCNADTDCESGVCRDDVCQAPSCEDGVRNGDELDVDCLGACGSCRDGQVCEGNEDCQSLTCDPFSSRCISISDCAALRAQGFALNGVYTIDPDGPGPGEPFETYCDMETDGGGWTLAMKMDGLRRTFHYDSEHWTSRTPYNPEYPDLDGVEAKLMSYGTVPFHEIRLGMQLGDEMRWVQIFHASNSLYDLFSSGTYVPTQHGLTYWTSLLAETSLQTRCMLEGFNVVMDADPQHARARIGVVASNRGGCTQPTSRLGFGMSGASCAQDDNNSVGNEARCNDPNQNQMAFGVVLVRRLERLPTSCLDLHQTNPMAPSGVAIIDPDGDGDGLPFRTWCDQTSEGGGWTLLMKMNGTDTTAGGVFHYDSEHWASGEGYQEESVRLDDGQEIKTRGYGTLPFTELLLGMEIEGEATRWAVLPYTATSLLDVIGDGVYRPTEQGEAFWRGLMPDPSLHAACMREGFNARSDVENSRGARTRLGLISDNNELCDLPDSRIGFGGAGNSCGMRDGSSVGNEANCFPEQGNRNIGAWGYVFAR